MIPSLSARQFDESLAALRGALEQLRKQPPAGGWLAAVRSALGMPMTALARRLRVTPATARAYELGEQEGTITLATLRRVAQALDADFVYAIVPRKPLAEQIEGRARELAQREVDPVARTMALESQHLSDEARERAIEDRTESLIRRPRALWR